MQKSWYLERIEFLLMPTDTLAGIETEANDSGFLVSLVLVSLKPQCGFTLLSFTNMSSLGSERLSLKSK